MAKVLAVAESVAARDERTRSKLVELFNAFIEGADGSTLGPVAPFFAMLKGPFRPIIVKHINAITPDQLDGIRALCEELLK